MEGFDGPGYGKRYPAGKYDSPACPNPLSGSRSTIGTANSQCRYSDQARQRPILICGGGGFQREPTGGMRNSIVNPFHMLVSGAVMFLFRANSLSTEEVLLIRGGYTIAYECAEPTPM